MVSSPEVNRSRREFHTYFVFFISRFVEANQSLSALIEYVWKVAKSFETSQNINCVESLSESFSKRVLYIICVFLVTTHAHKCTWQHHAWVQSPMRGRLCKVEVCWSQLLWYSANVRKHHLEIGEYLFIMQLHHVRHMHRFHLTQMKTATSWLH